MDVSGVDSRYSSLAAASSGEEEVQNHILTFVEVREEVMNIPLRICDREVYSRCEVCLCIQSRTKNKRHQECYYFFHCYLFKTLLKTSGSKILKNNSYRYLSAFLTNKRRESPKKDGKNIYTFDHSQKEGKDLVVHAVFKTVGRRIKPAVAGSIPAPSAD